ncbi:hypothetical protein HYFRA_00011896 [Hymenoscyphus fraxineus]|uniref:Uncharacterized protein n=1 Tax=Hymenoscyphus fraxineus TaxID=746836 RepID=A0A9N9KY65_9HELO|nr:hypothetical protein HYFRA_00011896 [Hymenoscyphus fraxineus]
MSRSSMVQVRPRQEDQIGRPVSRWDVEEMYFQYSPCHIEAERIHVQTQGADSEVHFWATMFGDVYSQNVGAFDGVVPSIWQKLVRNSIEDGRVFWVLDII